MKESEDVRFTMDLDTIVLNVMEDAGPGGNDDDIEQATVRLSIEEALEVLDSLKRAIKWAVDKR